MTEEEVLLDEYHAFRVLASTEGGKLLVTKFTEDVVSLVNLLANQYKNLSLVELQAHCADLQGKLNVIHILSRAEEAEKELKESLQV